jgi:spore coat polysaccharide biosynthesis protein SpsF
MRKVFCVIQARVTSSRFHNKIFELINEKYAINYVIEACNRSIVDEVLLVVPEKQVDYFNSKINSTNFSKLSIIGGSEDNVLERYTDSLMIKGCKKNDIVVRITSDCFAMNSVFIDKSIEYFKKNSFDYINNSTVTRVLSEDNPDDYQTDTSTPDGFNVEVFNFNSLLEAYTSTYSKYDIEHVTPWIKRNKNCSVFNTGKICLTGKFSVDTPEDLEIIKAYYKLFNSGRIEYEL